MLIAVAVAMGVAAVLATLAPDHSHRELVCLAIVWAGVAFLFGYGLQRL